MVMVLPMPDKTYSAFKDEYVALIPEKLQVGHICAAKAEDKPCVTCKTVVVRPEYQVIIKILRSNGQLHEFIRFYQCKLYHSL